MTPTGRPASHICLTNPFAWPHVKRGTETLIRSWAGWLHRNGHRVEIVAGSARSTKEALDGVPVSLFRARRFARVHADLDEETTFIPAMAWHLRRARPDVVHSYLYQDGTAARLSGRPYLVSYGGIALPSSTVGHPIKRRLFRFASEGARVLLCPSEAAASHLHQAFGYKADVIPNGIDVTRFSVGGATRDDVILCPATPDDRRKRVEVLVDAFATVAAARPSFELVLAGGASPQTRRTLLDRLPDPVRSRVRFTGDLDAAALCREYERATVTCLPSLNEAFGMVLVESLACGTPAVGAAHGAIPEILDEDVGALFEPDDAASCANALLDALDRQGGDLSARCRERAAAYDWSVIGPRLLKVYEAVCE